MRKTCSVNLAFTHTAVPLGRRKLTANGFTAPACFFTATATATATARGWGWGLLGAGTANDHPEGQQSSANPLDRPS